MYLISSEFASPKQLSCNQYTEFTVRNANEFPQCERRELVTRRGQGRLLPCSSSGSSAGFRKLLSITKRVPLPGNEQCNLDRHGPNGLASSQVSPRNTYAPAVYEGARSYHIRPGTNVFIHYTIAPDGHTTFTCTQRTQRLEWSTNRRLVYGGRRKR